MATAQPQSFFYPPIPPPPALLAHGISLNFKRRFAQRHIGSHADEIVVHLLRWITLLDVPCRSLLFCVVSIVHASPSLQKQGSQVLWAEVSNRFR